MPWDGTTLFVAPFGAEGETGTPRPVAGGRDESIFQPSFSPGGRLTFVSDRSGWWNLYQERESGIVALCSRKAEFGLPQWVFGMSTYGFVDEETVLCIYRVNGIERLARLELEEPATGRSLDTPHQLRRSRRGGPSRLLHRSRRHDASRGLQPRSRDEPRRGALPELRDRFRSRLSVRARGHRVSFRERTQRLRLSVPAQTSAAAGSRRASVPR